MLFLIPLLFLSLSLILFPLGLEAAPPTSAPVDVNVTNDAANAVPVTVGNDASSPVSVTVENDGSQPVPTTEVFVREPFGTFFSDHFDLGGIKFFLDVPADKRLVIEHIAPFAQTQAGQRLTRLVVRLVTGSVLHAYTLLITDNVDTQLWFGTYTVRLYADPGSQVEFEIPGPEGHKVELSVSGYFLDPNSPTLSP
jgi:hypothetical protein